MSESPAERPKDDDTDSEPNFVRVRIDAISEDNWPEYAAKGFGFLQNQPNLTDPEQRSEFERIEGIFGSRNVFTGAAFDEVEGRPLRHRPGVGIYLAPEHDDKLAYDASKTRRERRQSPWTGPASS